MKRSFCVLILMIDLLIPFHLIPVNLVELHPEKIGKQYLVLIAINRYKYWKPLTGPVNDAKEIGEILKSRYYIDKVVELYDENACTKRIIRLFRELQGKLKENDSILIFYAGHGYFDNASGTGYWIPVDGGSDKDEKVKWIPYSTLIGLIGNIKSKHILLISDSCNSGDIIKVYRADSPKIDKPNFQKAYSFRSRQVITSCSSERAPDSSEFAKQLKRALEENRESNLDPLTLYDRIRQGMKETMPLFGEINGTGHQVGASFLLFLKGSKVDFGKVSKPEPPVSNVSTPQGNSTSYGIDLSDIKSKAQQGKEKKVKERSDWSDWLEKYEVELEKIKEVDFDTEVPIYSKKEAWVRLLKDYYQDNPFSEKDDELKTYAEERIKYWEEFSIPESIPIPKEPAVRLRSQYKKMGEKDVKEMLIKYNFFSSCLSGVFKNRCNPDGCFNNEFATGKKVVVDLTTGLMWDRRGSAYRMQYEMARDWINELNRNKYAGYNDWRLPNLEEGASLLSKKRKAFTLYTNEIFSDKQIQIWTVDPYIPPFTGSPAVWEVDFFSGIVNRAFWVEGKYARAVRTAR
jgi:hypothetical protein